MHSGRCRILQFGADIRHYTHLSSQIPLSFQQRPISYVAEIQRFKKIIFCFPPVHHV